MGQSSVVRSRRRRARGRCALAIGVAVLCLAAEEPRATTAISLERLLDRLGQAARLHADNALRFTCRETITHFTERGPRRLDFDYIYLPARDGKLVDDYRLRRRRGSSRAGRPVSLADYDLPGVLERPYMWALFFDPALRSSGLYRYALAGESRVLDRPAIGLSFAPVQPTGRDAHHWYGIAWIDRETLQLLRVEAVPAAEQANKLRFEADLRRAGSAPGRHRSTHLFQQVSTDFAVSRDGLRFPSQVTLRRSRYEVWGESGSSGYEEYPVFRVKQRYSDYRFFGVTTEQEIQPPSGQ